MYRFWVALYFFNPTPKDYVIEGSHTSRTRSLFIVNKSLEENICNGLMLLRRVACDVRAWYSLFLWTVGCAIFILNHMNETVLLFHCVTCFFVMINMATGFVCKSDTQPSCWRTYKCVINPEYSPQQSPSLLLFTVAEHMSIYLSKCSVFKGYIVYKWANL